MLNEFLILAIANIFAVASPGVDFALVLKNTLQSGKSAGIVTAVGIGLGISVHMTYTLLGVAVLIANSELIFNTIKVVGALYLVYLAYLSFQSKPAKIQSETKVELVELKNITALKQGFIVNVFNPKATVFFIALFTNIVSKTTPYWVQTLYGIWLVIYAILWFSFVAWAFSRAPVRNWYFRKAHLVDWAMGVFLILLATQLFL